MASDRIGKKSAKLVGVPPFEIVKVSTDFMLEQPQVIDNIKNVPLNQPLVDSILKQDMLNPLEIMFIKTNNLNKWLNNAIKKKVKCDSVMGQAITLKYLILFYVNNRIFF